MLALVSTVSSVHSAELVCGGTVAELAYHAEGRFMVRFSNMNVPVFFCSPEREWTVAGTGYITGPETCKTLYSTFLAAKLAGQPITNVYFDGEQVPATCNGWASWSNANIRYFTL